MNATVELTARTLAIGIGATVLMDAWLAVLNRLGIRTLNFAMVGRWIGHWQHGVFVHTAIAKAAPVKGERALGWLFHWTTGIAFAALFVVIEGAAWVANPSALPAMAWGVATVAAPWFVMQPAMGAGIASSKAPSPAMARAKSLATHFIFGIGLYAAALLVATAWR